MFKKQECTNVSAIQREATAVVRHQDRCFYRWAYVTVIRPHNGPKTQVSLHVYKPRLVQIIMLH